jgi:hypothetical protein
MSATLDREKTAAVYRYAGRIAERACINIPR